MRRSIALVALLGCSSDSPKPFGLDPPGDGGVQVHVEAASGGASGGDGGAGLERCTIAPAPAGAMIAGFTLLARPGLRHATLYLVSGGQEGTTDCRSIRADAEADPGKPPWAIYQSPRDATMDEWSYPGGGALRIPTGRKLMLDTHFAQAPDGSEAWLNVRYASPPELLDGAAPDGSVAGHPAVWPFSIAIRDILVTPLMSATESANCAIPRERVQFLLAVTREKEHGTHATFEVLTNPNQTIVESREWDDPDAFRAPPAIDAAGTPGVRLSCSWFTPEQTVLRSDDEACRVSGVLTGARGPLIGTTRLFKGSENCTVREESAQGGT